MKTNPKICSTLLATALLSLAPLSYSQVDSGPTPNPNGKQTSDVKTDENATAPVSESAMPETAATPNPNGKQTSDVKPGVDNTSAGAGKADTKSTLSKTDKQFLMMAAQGGMLEVKVSELADKSASSAEVKKFAAMMVKDHTKANSELMALADTKGLTLPTKLNEKHQAKADKMMALNGAAFDTAYIKDMNMAHEKDVAMFEKASTSADDADVKAFAAKTLPTLKGHLEHVKMLTAK